MSNNSTIRNWVIYKIISPSGREYIGKTANFEQRFANYKGHFCQNQTLLMNSFNKYGFINHSIIILESFVGTNDYASGKEMFWIRSYMTNFSKWGKLTNGLNLTDGGEGRIGAIASGETRQKLRDAHKRNPGRYKKMIGWKPTKEQIEKTKLTKSKRTYPPRKNNPISDETRQKMSLAKKGKDPPNKGKTGIQIAWNKGLVGVTKSWNKGKKFEGSDEERKFKFGSHNIGNSYNKGRKQKPEFIAARVARQIGVPNKALFKPIVRYNKRGEMVCVYKSIKEAAEKSVYSVRTISSIAKGEKKLTNTFLFKYKAA